MSTSRATQRVVWIVLALNLIVAATKGVYGGLTGSLAVASDAVHSLTDALSNVVGLVAIRMAMRAPDEKHPYGYQKVEILAAAGIGMIIALSALEFGGRAIRGILGGVEPPEVTSSGLVLLAGTFIVNIIVATYEAREGRRLNSPFLIADSAHTASDVLVTMAVIISQLAVAQGIGWADAAAALIVLVFVFRIAWRIFNDNAGILLDRAIVDATKVKEVVCAIPEVVDCHRIRSRGPKGAVHLDLHLTLDDDLPLRRAHDISHDAENVLRRQFPDLIDVTIHVEPRGDPAESL